MSELVYVSQVHLERVRGPLRTARLPAEVNEVAFGVHGAIAEHYGLDPASLENPHATTLDYVAAAAGG